MHGDENLVTHAGDKAVRGRVSRRGYNVQAFGFLSASYQFLRLLRVLTDLLPQLVVLGHRFRLAIFAWC